MSYFTHADESIRCKYLILIIEFIIMNQEISLESAQDESFINKLKSNFSWKSALMIGVPLMFIIYPRPFLYLLRPFINRINKTYCENRPKLKKILFTTNRFLTPEKIVKNKLYEGNPENIIVINLLQDKMGIDTGERGSSAGGLNRSVSWKDALAQDSSIQVRAQNTSLRIKLLMLEATSERQQNYAILIKGSPELLRIIEAKIYDMDPEEYYKIPMFVGLDEIHILQAVQNSRSYEHKIAKLRI